MTDVLLDTHCHLDAFPNPSQVLATSAAADVHLVAVTNSPDDYRRMATLLPRGGSARAALGLHPLHAHRLGMGGVLRFCRHAAGAAWIGEIGLDFSPAGRDTRDAQLKTFDALLALPQLRDRPVTVHTRGADKIAVHRLVDAGIRAVLHWYTGSLGVADEALAAGLHFSVNPSMLTSAKGRTLLARLPQDRVLCETDGPYARRSGHPCQPADLPTMVEDLARLWNVSTGKAHSQICANQRRITGEEPPLQPKSGDPHPAGRLTGTGTAAAPGGLSDFPPLGIQPDAHHGSFPLPSRPEARPDRRPPGNRR